LAVNTDKPTPQDPLDFGDLRKNFEQKVESMENPDPEEKAQQAYL